MAAVIALRSGRSSGSSSIVCPRSYLMLYLLLFMLLSLLLLLQILFLLFWLLFLLLHAETIEAEKAEKQRLHHSKKIKDRGGRTRSKGTKTGATKTSRSLLTKVRTTGPRRLQTTFLQQKAVFTKKNYMGRKTLIVLARLISADYTAGTVVLVVVAVVLGGL